MLFECRFVIVYCPVCVVVPCGFVRATFVFLSSCLVCWFVFNSIVVYHFDCMFCWLFCGVDCCLVYSCLLLCASCFGCCLLYVCLLISGLFVACGGLCFVGLFGLGFACVAFLLMLFYCLVFVLIDFVGLCLLLVG